ncbi:hypothetical protein P4O66_000953 [Electrophorus voltai]|uniref:Reverse transcriptase domain-containing protein n=1 Tax=Electrophorus voltai TaxID=2609070 RepID=A0AAD8ZG05_9TELE|nr:hypothetical protein P4O66_000953 [Electrophorus voltai]
MRHIKTQLPPSLDPLQFVYCSNHSSDDAISTTLHLALTHLDKKGTYVRMLFIDFSSAFNTIVLQHLIGKLSLLGLNTSLCYWILDFLTGRPQSVRIGSSTSNTTTLSTGAPQGSVLSPLLFTLLTHDCAAMHSSNHIIKFADDTTVVGLINKDNESAYREEVQELVSWCKVNNLYLNVDKTKEMVVDFRRARRDHSPLAINGSSVEIVKNIKFLGVHIAENLTWTLNTSSITKRAQQHLYFLRKLREAQLPSPILNTFYRGTVESILSSCIITWFGNCTAFDHKTLQRIVRTAEKIIGVALPSITNIYITRCIRKATNIVKDPTHPSHELFTLLPSGRSPSPLEMLPPVVLLWTGSAGPEPVRQEVCASCSTPLGTRATPHYRMTNHHRRPAHSAEDGLSSGRCMGTSHTDASWIPGDWGEDRNWCPGPLRRRRGPPPEISWGGPGAIEPGPKRTDVTHNNRKKGSWVEPAGSPESRAEARVPSFQQTLQRVWRGPSKASEANRLWDTPKAAGERRTVQGRIMA